MAEKIYGRWAVVSEIATEKGAGYWTCRCICGSVKEVASRSLLAGSSKSCGCLASELSSARLRTAESLARRTTHGLTGTKEYAILATMKDRCYNKTNPKYLRYGARGITICERWLESVENFIADMGNKPAGMSLDRIDNDGNYCKENCRWATPSEQKNNASSSVRYLLGDQLYTVDELAQRAGLSYSCMRDRLVKLRWPVEEAVAIPKRGKPSRKLEKSPSIKLYKD